ncbi:VWA domain-containing protein [Bacillus swezeyi]|uniref:VWFA domain-containing protein n=1 Tax=Bacillus swezeyi TaxID=1925020 RepID=A0A1R1S278_9BACI|nr:VWA domain-containing protein [Bacillus swezeyi]MEC1259283.1 VWA domain-containing protein [Bacillus swezeyi]MED2927755.1 VWA domain-containing protein [Bacillus swezeyi]MED2942014.1 VWA domain-containing protein [Bacillus swezeyi]MED2965332.1 VWA domain-containing protein [Bacillus swezeyi]MED3071593.1 VWA domain-containing protein [Bacillus swezeyi]
MKKRFTLLTTFTMLLSLAPAAFAAEDGNAADNSKKDVNVAVVLDASGSMAQRVEGDKKFDIAKESVTDFADLLPSDANVMLNVFGHKGNNKNSGKEESCGTTETLYDLQPFSANGFQNSLSGIKPTGWSPIAKSLYDVKDDLADKDGKNYVYIVTDGEETCGGDPVQAAKDLRQSNIKTIVNIVGLDVKTVKEKEKLKKVAKAGGGKLIEAESANDFKKVWKEEGGKMSK